MNLAISIGYWIAGAYGRFSIGCLDEMPKISGYSLLWNIQPCNMFLAFRSLRLDIESGCATAFKEVQPPQPI